METDTDLVVLRCARSDSVESQQIAVLRVIVREYHGTGAMFALPLRHPFHIPIPLMLKFVKRHSSAELVSHCGECKHLSRRRHP